jgi:hypothetical protein
MKHILFAAALLCAPPAFACEPKPAEEQPWFCEDDLADGQPLYEGCLYEGGRAGSPDMSQYRELVCRGSSEHIEDDDPGLVYFRNTGSLEDSKVALAIERVNSCAAHDREE